MSKTSPMQRTLKRLREEGYYPAICERWNPWSKRREDLYGIIDILAVGKAKTLAIQCTTMGHAPERIRKIMESPILPELIKCKWSIQVWGWRKLKKEGWTPKITYILKAGK